MSLKVPVMWNQNQSAKGESERGTGVTSQRYRVPGSGGPVLGSMLGSSNPESLNNFIFELVFSKCCPGPKEHG